jgi:PAS domain S-box-containing protein
MNRSIDVRSDLYALGVTFYQMLIGALPFTASDPLEWVHCHIARKPTPPGERLENIPAPVSAIIIKLLAKTPEERYQTAGGLERDLRRCLAEWEARRRIEDFPLGVRDVPSKLLIPEKLYGRQGELATLLACFDRIINGGAPELVLVSGYSGIGKSSVVNELQEALVPPRGLFASGKFDQYKRDIPYATLVQAFQSLVHPLLSKSDAGLAKWRDALQKALGANGRLMADLIPELTLIIGDQPPAPELPSQQAQVRFQLVFTQFIGVFARPEHPLALFLDDLQWLDAATLDLLEELLTRSDLHHLMLIGAYRDNEVDTSHPLMRKLDTIKSTGGKVAEITLAPLAREHLGQLITAALRCEPERAAPLADLVYGKTSGNPFFAIQFLSSLAEEGLLTFDHNSSRWLWDLGRIQAKGYTDNVVDLMVGKLTRLPVESRNALQQLACLGNAAEITRLATVLRITEEEVDKTLWTARRQELVARIGRHYRFVHDRVQEAAYSLVPNELRMEEHLRIGRLLVVHTPPEKIEEAIFDIINQLNRGITLITSGEERDHLAELNLLAGRRAKASAAYASALTYLVTGAALLSQDIWERRYKLAFAFELQRAECEFLTAALTDADQRLAELAHKAGNLPDLAAVTRLREQLFMTLGRNDRAVEVGLDYLRRIGIDWSAHPTKEEARQEYQGIWQRVGDRPIETLLDLPRLADPNVSATMDVLVEVVSPAMTTDENLLCLLLCRMANLSLEHGNSHGSCTAYICLGMVLGPHFGDYQAGVRFAKLGLDLVEHRGLDRFKARAYLMFGTHMIQWTSHMRTAVPMLRRAFDEANKVGDLTFATYSRNDLIMVLLAAGDPLSTVQGEAEAALDFSRHARFGFMSDIIAPQLQLIRTLRGLTPMFGDLSDAGFDESRSQRHLEDDPRLSTAACWYWIRKLQARFFAGAYAPALDAALKAERLLWTSPSCFEMAEYHLYAALTRATLWDAANAAERAQYLEALTDHYRQLQEWTGNCPENFENRAALVGAEIARIEGRTLDAMNLYERAIRSAQANGFVHNEALASELAARFNSARGFEIAAYGYLRNARSCYLRWGADAKVQQLDAADPRLRTEVSAAASTSTIAAPVEHLDLATVIKVSQAISGEIVFERALETFMRTAIEQAGAERGVLIFSGGVEHRVAAEATTGGDLVSVQLRDEPVAANVVPESLLHQVLRTRESVILDNAAAQSPYSADPYIRQRQARSVLCLPLLNQAKVIGVLFLENNLTASVFAPARIAVLKLLASQAAISFENTRLYRDLAEREARIRRLVDADVIGIVIWDLDGRLLDANDAFLRMVQYERKDLNVGLRWFDMTPPEWQDVHALEELEELQTTGMMQTREKEFFRKDGSRVPVLIGAAAFEGQPDQGVAYILDLTERKRTEAQARESERRYREIQADLAHANRVATTGQLSASIAHEVNQPLTAMITNTQAALRWLEALPPNLEEIRDALASILRNGTRASDVIGRVRALIKKTPPRRDHFEINDAIREVIELALNEAGKNGVSMRAQLAERLPLIEGDRVQLQQVVLNMVINAIEAMSPGHAESRELLILTEKGEPDGVLVSVRDVGPGLAPEFAERVFEAFYTTKSGGMGMGLSICCSIVEAHGGHVWTKPNSPRGAIFGFSVPRSQ